MRRHDALFSKYGVSVRTHVHEGICIHWWLSMGYQNILLQVEVEVHNCILHDLCMPAATLILLFSPLKRYNVILKDYQLNYFSRKFYDYEVNCIFIR